jgi:hypothetical protein
MGLQMKKKGKNIMKEKKETENKRKRWDSISEK